MQYFLSRRISTHRKPSAALFLTLCVSSAGAAAGGYVQSNLVTDDQAFLTSQGYTPAAHVDPLLQNPWGIAFFPGNPGNPLWTANNGTNSATLYDGQGNKIPLNVTVSGAPTGQVNGGFNFHLAGQVNNSLFIFASENGTISEWNTDGAVFSNTSQVAVDHSSTGAIYKGLAEATVGGAHRLYATNFHSGQVEVFDSNYGSVINPPGAFTDPNLPVGYVPFGIQNIQGDLFVTYAKAAGADDVPGIGHGFVDVYHADGTLVSRVASRGVLNSPWGVALAPASFGEFAGDLLIGNFGDGLINVFDSTTHAFIDHLVDINGEAIQIDGLWGLIFGAGALNAAPNDLYFTAGIGDEAHGLFGVLNPAPVPLPASLPLLTGALGWLGLRRRAKASVTATT